jgi:hypothetical protein
MPDDDRFPRYLSPAWRKVLRCVQGHDPAERVGDLPWSHLPTPRCCSPDE